MPATSRPIAPMLAKNFEDGNPAGWLMSEKLDGVRALWNGSDLLTRNGNPIHAPAWFTDALPPVALDGELWMGRGKFQATVSVVRTLVPDDEEWRGIRFMVFDAPESEGGFESRLAAASSELAGNPIAEVVIHEICRDRRHLDEFAAALLAGGAEGVMLRKANSHYEHARSKAMLRHKPTFTDEATVTGHDPGKGRNAGVVGALTCDWNGVRFNVGVGLTDEVRATPPKIGVRVTFSYSGLTDQGVPRFPVFVAERNYD